MNFVFLTFKRELYIWTVILTLKNNRSSYNITGKYKTNSSKTINYNNTVRTIVLKTYTHTKINESDQMFRVTHDRIKFMIPIRRVCDPVKRKPNSEDQLEAIFIPSSKIRWRISVLSVFAVFCSSLFSVMSS